jgi:hypothetical protein
MQSTLSHGRRCSDSQGTPHPIAALTNPSARSTAVGDMRRGSLQEQSLTKYNKVASILSQPEFWAGNHHFALTLVMLSTSHDLHVSDDVLEVDSSAMDTSCALNSYRCSDDVYLGMFDWESFCGQCPAVDNFCTPSLPSEAQSAEMSVRELSSKESSEERRLVLFASIEVWSGDALQFS